MKYNKRRGFFCKMVKRRRDSLLNRGKGRGLWAKCPVFFLPRAGKQGRGPALVGGAKSGGPGLGGGPG